MLDNNYGVRTIKITYEDFPLAILCDSQSAECEIQTTWDVAQEYVTEVRKDLDRQGFDWFTNESFDCFIDEYHFYYASRSEQ
jgi:hypothetical protein